MKTGKVDILDASILGKDAWDNRVSSHTIMKCWIKSGILPLPMQNYVTDNIPRKAACDCRNDIENVRSNLVELSNTIPLDVADVDLQEVREALRLHGDHSIDTWVNMEDLEEVREAQISDEYAAILNGLEVFEL